MMANPGRVAGHRGWQPRDRSRKIPVYESYLDPVVAMALPPVPLTADIDRASKVADWPMYSNGPDPENASCCPGSPDGCGDCMWAAPAHMLQGWSAYAGTEVTIPDSEVVKGYSTTGYNPQTGTGDNGTDAQTVLEYLRNVGYTDTAGKVHKIAGYAMLGNPADEVLLGQVLDTFGSVYVEVSLTEAQETQFASGQPWVYQAGSPGAGGHGICLQRRAAGPDSLRFVTWGALQPADRSFAFNQIVAAYAVVSQDWIEASGVTVTGLDLQQLLADMSYVS
jgi:hypothetical protein